MEVILKDDVVNLGHRGDLVKVADGYARNFLLPRKLALQATSANKAVVEQMKNAAARRSATEKALAEELVVKLEPVVLDFTRKSGEAGHLFGSVTSADIATELAAKGFEIDRRKIQLDESLKTRWRLHRGHQALPRSHRAREGQRAGRSHGRSRRSAGRRACRGNGSRRVAHLNPPSRRRPVRRGAARAFQAALSLRSSRIN